uniref:Uncharacterized protein n=1 Tax=Nymphaea colorata TaxID=210225 RepID=A0A5K1BBM8_9MAGN
MEEVLPEAHRDGEASVLDLGVGFKKGHSWASTVDGDERPDLSKCPKIEVSLDDDVPVVGFHPEALHKFKEPFTCDSGRLVGRKSSPKQTIGSSLMRSGNSGNK